MSTSALRSRWAQSSSYVCDRCSLRLQSPKYRRRWLHSSLRRANESSPQVSSKSVLAVLEQRGYVNQIAGTKDDLHNLLSTKQIGAYVGIDPTASSMHVGHLIPFMALFWLYLYGHRTITLVGGGTASVGDPTGRFKARPQQSYETRNANIEGIEAQLKRLWKNVALLGMKHGQGVSGMGQREGQILNNDEWLRQTSIMDVVGSVGAGLRLGAMLGRDTVKNRMTAKHDEGMSFAEFCYPVLQAWDWWHMYKTFDVQMQIGGSDQYGNILSGVDGIKYATKMDGVEPDALSAPLGFTVPLLTTSAGEKFGKSAGNAVWLDKEQTSVYDLYGFFVGLPDAEIEKYLNFFTFLPQSIIKETIASHNVAPERRIAQHLLAHEFVELVHGPEEAQLAQQTHLDRSNAISEITNIDVVLATQEVLGKPFAFVLHAAGLVETKSKASKLVESGGAYIINEGGVAEKIRVGELVEERHSKSSAENKRILVLRAGKWKLRTIEII